MRERELLSERQCFARADVGVHPARERRVQSAVAGQPAIHGCASGQCVLQFHRSIGCIGDYSRMQPAEQHDVLSRERGDERADVGVHSQRAWGIQPADTGQPAIQ